MPHDRRGDRVQDGPAPPVSRTDLHHVARLLEPGQEPLARRLTLLYADRKRQPIAVRRDLVSITHAIDGDGPRPPLPHTQSACPGPNEQAQRADPPEPPSLVPRTVAAGPARRDAGSGVLLGDQGPLDRRNRLLGRLEQPVL